MAKQPSLPPTDSIPDDEPAGLGKGHATPTRKEREAARRRPLVPNDRREAARQARQKAAATRERARIGLANGEERYLPLRDKGPQRRFVRDYVDARFSIGEAFIPLMVLFVLLTLIPAPAVQVYGLLALYAFILAGIVDVIILGFVLQRRLAAKFGASRVERGLRWYGAMRALQMRRLRLPKPMVKRRQYPS